jgi:hypothetical protein
LALSEVRLFPTARHPVVCTWIPARTVRPFRSPPFEPAVREGSIYGRGSCDDKSQMFAHVKAIECLLTTKAVCLSM